MKIKVLFICHGNICRSPMAEMVMKDMVRKLGREDEFEIASAATSREEIGNPIYPPAKRELEAHGVPWENRGARQMTKADYEYDDLIIGMDDNNMRNMRRLLGLGIGETAMPSKVVEGGKIHLLLEYASPDYIRYSGNVADPWYTGDFQATWEDVCAGCHGLLAML